ncbi:phage tail tape measure protein [Streptomyces sp. NPDC059165]|uniref:phage tail tape measure protein n=1 Tax=Streptomyces sp. NPDC059165 TaxID=3346751 RepID=UPI00367D4A8A
MPNVGFAAIQIIPSVRGIDQELRRQLSQPAAAAGNDAGRAAGGNFSDKLKLGIAAGAAAAGALLVKGLSDAMGQLDAKSLLQAQLGTSDAVAAAQGKVAGKLFSSGVSGSFQDAADAIKAVVQAGLAPPKATNAQLQAIGTKASDVATVFDQDLGGVTNAVAQLMRTGLAKNSTEAFDLITKGFQSGANKADDFLDTINEYSTQFRRVGLDGATATGLLAQGLKGGARDADQVADAIGQFGELALAGGQGVKDAFKGIGLNADDMAKMLGKGGKSAETALGQTLNALRGTKDEQVKLNAATALFGDPGTVMGDALFALNPATAAASAGMDKTAGATDKLGETIRSGPSHEIDVFTRGLQQGFVDLLGGVVLPIITDAVGWLKDHLGPAVDAVTSAVQGTVDWFKEWGVWLAPVGVLVGGLALALGASAIAAGASAAATGVWAAVTGTATAITGAWSAAMGVLNAVMALNPFVLVAIAVLALGTALVVAYKKSETFRAIVQAAWSGIQTAAKWAWNNVLKPVFGAFKTALGAVGTAASWLYKNAILPAWNAIKTVVSGVWNKGLKPVFNAIKTAVGLVADAFDTARAGIKLAWDKVSGIAKAPIRFVIDTVYNKGLVGVWNKVATAFGAEPMPTMPLPKGFATGGPVFGAGTETSDDVPAWLSRNEHVWTAKEVRGAGGHGAVLALRKWAAAGGGGALPGFKDGGGLFDWIGRGVAGVGSKAWEGIKKSTAWLKDGLEASARAGVKHVVDPLLRLIPGADTAFGRMIRRIPTRILDAIFGYSKKADAKGAGGVGTLGGVIPSGSRRTIISQALAAAGVPPPGTMAQWLAGMNTLITRESGWNASAINRWDSNAKAGIPSQGLAQTIPPTWAAYVPSSLRGRGILDPVGNVAASIRYIVARYGNITRVQQANANRPPAGYDSGGWLMPGVTAAVNATGRPEAVLTARQWDIAQAALARAGAPGLQPGDKLQLVVRDRAFDVYLEAVADSRVDATLRPAITAMRANRR